MNTEPSTHFEICTSFRSLLPPSPEEIHRRDVNYYASIFERIFARSTALAPHPHELFYIFSLATLPQLFSPYDLSFLPSYTPPRSLDCLQEGIDRAVFNYKWTHQKADPPFSPLLLTLGKHTFELCKAAPFKFSPTERRRLQLDAFRLHVWHFLPSLDLWMIRAFALLENPSACTPPSGEWARLTERIRFRFICLFPTRAKARMLSEMRERWRWLRT